MATTVTWKWWYPVGCIETDDVETDTVAAFDGEDAAAEIVQQFINANGTDGCENFEVMVITPAKWAGVYDVELEWEPSTFARKRENATPETVTTPG